MANNVRNEHAEKPSGITPASKARISPGSQKQTIMKKTTSKQNRKGGTSSGGKTSNADLSDCRADRESATRQKERMNSMQERELNRMTT